MSPAGAPGKPAKRPPRWPAFPWRLSLGMLALAKQELSSAVMFTFGGCSVEKE